MKPIRGRSKQPVVIVIHHSGGSKDTPQEIAAWHQTEESGVFQKESGYNYIIDRKGVVHSGRPLDKVPVHCKHFNEQTVAICVCGNYENRGLPRSVRESLIRLLTVVCFAYGINPVVEVALAQGRSVFGVCKHGDLEGTDCPGRELGTELVSIRRRVAVSLRKSVLGKRKSVRMKLMVEGKAKQTAVFLERRLVDEI